MPKPPQKFYAVQNGRETGVFLTWAECEQQTKGYPGAKYQSFKNAAEAEAFVSGTSPSSSSGPASTSSTTNSKGKKRAMPADVADELKYDVVYCDGACKGNGQPGSVAGVGVWWEDNDPRNIAERCPGDQTNNRAELIAIVRTLETTPKSKKPLLIKTDSQYSINCFTSWLPRWVQNNFKTSVGDPVKNLAVIKYASALMKVRGLMGQDIRLQYIKGHSGNRGNDGADAQANLGALLPPEPERDWERAENEVLERAEEERRMSVSKPKPVPLQVDAGELAQPVDPPRKVRKVSHELPFSRLPAVSAFKKPLITSPCSVSPRRSSPLPVVEVSSSPPRDTQTHSSRSSEPKPSSSCSQADLGVGAITSQSSAQNTPKSPARPRSPIRRHGIGLFTTNPPPNAGFVREYSPLPSTSQGTRKLIQAPPKPETLSPTKPTAMSVDVADVNLSDYLDCAEDDDPFDDL